MVAFYRHTTNIGTTTKTGASTINIKFAIPLKYIFTAFVHEKNVIFILNV